MKGILIKALFGVLMASQLIACRKESDADAGGTAAKAMAGEWWIQIKVDNDPIVADYFKILTYNTSENIGTKMWMDDLQELWPFKIKMNADPLSKTFSADSSASEYSDIKVTLRNGKIIPGVSVGPFSKAVTDSIYVEAEFSDDPGTTYQLAGYRRTSFQEDDH